jgi:hypothetical protein
MPGCTFVMPARFEADLVLPEVGLGLVEEIDAEPGSASSQRSP